MATTLISYSLPPNIDATKAPLAFGKGAIPKLNRELGDATLIVRQRALMVLCDLVHDPEKIYEAITVGCVESLKKLLADSDSTVRHKATEVLYIMATHNVGRNAFIENDVILPISKLFDDEVTIVRKFAHQAIRMLSEIPSGAAGIVNAQLIPTLVNKLANELEDMQKLILDTLHFCMLVDAQSALKAGLMDVLKSLLSHDSSVIKSAAARDIMDVSIPLDGKVAACKDDEIVPELVQLLSDHDSDVQTNAAGALMAIAITTDGKFASLRSGAIPPLLKMIDSSSSEARLYAIKTLTMLAEAPAGRKLLSGYVEDITVKGNTEVSPAVRNAIAIAIKVITWKP